MHRLALLVTSLLLVAPAALAEGGSIVLAPNRPEAVVDCSRIQGRSPNVYEITIGGNADGLLALELKPHDRTMHPNFRLADADGGTVGEAFAEDDGMVTRLETAIGPGTYTLEVNDTHGVTRQSPYRLISRFQPVSDRYEPNDALGQAKLLPPGEYAQITLFRYKATDRDAFAFRHTGGTLHVEATPASNIRPNVTVVNAHREEVGAGFAANPGAALTYDVYLPAGIYVLIFSDGDATNLPHPINVMARSD